MTLSIVIAVLTIGLVVLLASGIPVALGLLILGIAGFLLTDGWSALKFVGGIPWAEGTSFEIMAIPMYVYVGFLLQRSGMVELMFRMIMNWFGRMPGSLGVVSLIAAGMFSSMSGSGSATAATLGLIVRPEAERYGFDRKLILGCLNGGANLAPIIPPSVVMVLYGTLAEQPVTRLFAAGLVPGLMLLAIMIAYVIAVALYKPQLAPPVASVSWREKFESLQVLPLVMFVVGIMLGGLLLGWFTPTEAACLGVLAAYVAILIFHRFNFRKIWPIIWQGSREAASVATVIMFLTMSSFIYSHVLTVVGAPQAVAAAMEALNISQWQLIMLLLLLMIIMGMFMDGLTMMVIVVPFMLPILKVYNIDLIWFGVFVTVMVELGSLTPPFGLHMFILQSVMGVSYQDVVMGSLPFVFLWLMGVVLLVQFPAIATWLPKAIFG